MKLPTLIGPSKYHKEDVERGAKGYSTIFRFTNLLTGNNEKTEETAQFYKDVFGFVEFRRNMWEDRLEIVMDLGASVEEALNHETSVRLIVMTGKGDQPSKSANIGLLVSSIKAAYENGLAWGATIERELKMGGTSGMYHTAMLRDPSGSIVEMIEPVTPNSWKKS